MNSENRLEKMTYKQVKDRRYQLAVLSWGATEAHNYHLPYGTDNYETTIILSQAADNATAAGASILLLPHIPYGVNTGQADIPYVINMNPSTQKAILCDIAQSLVNSHIDKLLIFNGHGGNDFKSIIREIGPQFPNLLICTCNWFQVLHHANYFTHPGEHADEMETSLMMFLYPDLVLPLAEAGNGQHKKFKVQGLNEPWAWAERQWSKVTNDTGIGNPGLATAEKGEKFFRDVTQVLGKFLLDLTKTPGNAFYEY